MNRTIRLSGLLGLVGISLIGCASPNTGAARSSVNAASAQTAAGQRSISASSDQAKRTALVGAEAVSQAVDQQYATAYGALKSTDFNAAQVSSLITNIRAKMEREGRQAVTAFKVAGTE